jgi:hypothetical protein
MKHLSDYYAEENSKLFMSLGVFFAFSNAQFENQRIKEVEYYNVGGGMICPKSNVKKLLKGLKKNHINAIKRDKDEHTEEEIILRELRNHEAFYTGDIFSVVEHLKEYEYTLARIKEIYLNQIGITE